MGKFVEKEVTWKSEMKMREKRKKKRIVNETDCDDVDRIQLPQEGVQCRVSTVPSWPDLLLPFIDQRQEKGCLIQPVSFGYHVWVCGSAAAAEPVLLNGDMLTMNLWLLRSACRDLFTSQ